MNPHKLTTNQKVAGSSPAERAKKITVLQVKRGIRQSPPITPSVALTAVGQQ